VGRTLIVVPLLKIKHPYKVPLCLYERYLHEESYGVFAFAAFNHPKGFLQKGTPSCPYPTCSCEDIFFKNASQCFGANRSPGSKRQSRPVCYNIKGDQKSQCVCTISVRSFQRLRVPSRGLGNFFSYSAHAWLERSSAGRGEPCCMIFTIDEPARPGHSQYTFSLYNFLPCPLNASGIEHGRNDGPCSGAGCRPA
jgi:hypothetical protein